tara:strand:- start:1060 stop:2151 length:1092 start_codon:yes stop_codon:yes gene_type:complete
MKIPYINLKDQWEDDKKELLPIIESILSLGIYVGGEEVEKFEENIINYCKSKYCVALNSGTDALTLALHTCGIKKGDEVITTSNSFIASTAVISHLGAKPVFVDVQEDQNIDPTKIEKAINSKTKAIMPVHLTGRICEMKLIDEIATKNNLIIIEDAAQAIGSQYNNQYSGTFGKVGCFSTHPLKNLNACGDGGFIITNDEKIYNKIRSLRTHGMVERDIIYDFGYVSRMDNLQAAILNYRIKNLDQIIEKRRLNAKKYFEKLDRKKIFIPDEKKIEFNSYHTFVIQSNNRDNLKKYLKENHIETAIHYPIPIHLQPAAKFLNYKKGDFPMVEKQANEILTLPINQYLSDTEINKIIELINGF